MTADFQDINESTLKHVPPVLPWEVFADWIHVPPGVVRGWIDRGYLPTIRSGKHLMVNVELYRKQLLEKED